jgi:hypothetical protein
MMIIKIITLTYKICCKHFKLHMSEPKIREREKERKREKVLKIFVVVVILVYVP